MFKLLLTISFVIGLIGTANAHAVGAWHGGHGYGHGGFHHGYPWGGGVIPIPHYNNGCLMQQAQYDAYGNFIGFYWVRIC